MKTFTDYINEKQNFIFGGKANLSGKEYLKNLKTFDELRPGDDFYKYYIREGNLKTSLHGIVKTVSEGVFITIVYDDKRKNNKVEVFSKEGVGQKTFDIEEDLVYDYSCWIMSTCELSKEEAEKIEKDYFDENS